MLSFACSFVADNSTEATELGTLYTSNLGVQVYFLPQYSLHPSQTLEKFSESTSNCGLFQRLVSDLGQFCGHCSSWNITSRLLWIVASHRFSFSLAVRCSTVFLSRLHIWWFITSTGRHCRFLQPSWSWLYASGYSICGLSLLWTSGPESNFLFGYSSRIAWTFFADIWRLLEITEPEIPTNSLRSHLFI